MRGKRAWLKVVLPVAAAALLLTAGILLARRFGENNGAIAPAVRSVLSLPYAQTQGLRVEDAGQLENHRAQIGEYFAARFGDVMTENCAAALAKQAMYLLPWCRQETYRSEVADFSAKQTGGDYGRFDCKVRLVQGDGSVADTLAVGGRYQLAEDGRVSFLDFDKAQLMALADLYYSYFPAP